MKKLFCLALILCMLLCACAQPDNPPETQVTEPSASETQLPETTSATQATEATDLPTEPPLLYTSPLTGEAIAQPMTDRPYAVMLNNIKAAMPQHGVSQADILYEILAEGNITRCLGIFSDISSVEKLGSVRSARKYYVELARTYDAIYVHAGGSEEAYNYLSGKKVDHMDGVKGDGKYYYRDKDRLNSGYALEHTMFIAGSSAVECATAKKMTLSRDQALSFGLNFAQNSSLAGTAANTVTVNFNTGSKPNSSTKKTVLTYKEADGLYYASQHGGDYIDGNTGATVAFKNVLVLNTNVYTQSDGTHRTVELVGSGKGVYACNGQMVTIRWSRAGEDQPFVYTLEDGAALTLAVGKTYVAIVPAKGVVDAQ